MNFIQIEDPRIKISNALIRQFSHINDEDIFKETVSVKDLQDLDDYLKLAKTQYWKKDYKWLMSLNNYLNDKGVALLKCKQYSDAISCYHDCLNLEDILRSEYISFNRQDLLIKSDSYLNTIKKRLYRACGSRLLIATNIEISIDTFKASLKNELKKIGVKKISDDELISTFIKSLPDISYKLDTTTYWTIICALDLKKIKELKALNNIISFLIFRKKMLRANIFERLSINPITGKENLEELQLCQEYLAEVFGLLGDTPNVVIELSLAYRYKAFLEDDLDKKYELLNKSINIINRLHQQNPNISIIENELNVALARRAEHLSFNYDNLTKRISCLNEAEFYYSKTKNPRSHLIAFLASYFTIKKLIIEDDKIELAIKSATELIDPKIKSLSFLVKQFPDIDVLILTCSLIHYFPLKLPTDSILRELYEIQPKIMNNKQLFPLWGIVNAYNILLTTIGDNAVLRNYFIDSFKTLIKSGQISDLEEVAKRLFFIGSFEDANPEIIGLLGKDESQMLEFKGSLSLDVNAFLFTDKTTFSKDRELDALAALVGFLNSSGGNLILGVLERRDDFIKFKNKFSDKFNKLILGVEREYGKDGYDGFIRKLEDITRSRIHENVPSLLQINKHKIDEHDLVHLIIPNGKNWYYLDNDKFYVREHNQTIEKKGIDADHYKSLNQR